jgi:hypothetical protein
MGVYKPITAPFYFIFLIIKPRNFAKRQCKLQGLTPPIHYFLFLFTPAREIWPGNGIVTNSPRERTGTQFYQLCAYQVYRYLPTLFDQSETAHNVGRAQDL